MTNRIELTTVASVECALREAKTVFIQVRFGCSERWVKLSKLEAKELLAGLDKNATPEHAEMFSGLFGTFYADNKNLYLG